MKNVVETEGPQMTSQHGANALHAGKARLHARPLMHTPTGPDTHPHARTHARANRPLSNIYCFPTATMIHEYAAMLRYTYIACLVFVLFN